MTSRSSAGIEPLSLQSKLWAQGPIMAHKNAAEAAGEDIYQLPYKNLFLVIRLVLPGGFYLVWVVLILPPEIMLVFEN